MFNLPANRVGLFCSKRWRTCSQVRGVGVCDRAHVLHTIRAQHNQCSFCIIDSVIALKLTGKGVVTFSQAAICEWRSDFSNASCEYQSLAGETSVQRSR